MDEEYVNDISNQMPTDEDIELYLGSKSTNTFGDGHLEICLKEAVIDVLEGLSEGWVLVIIY